MFLIFLSLQFINLPYPGRYIHLLIFIILYLFFNLKKIKLNTNDIIYIIIFCFYPIFITFFQLKNNILFYIKEILYWISFSFIGLYLETIFKNINSKIITKYFLIGNAIYIAISILIIFNINFFNKYLNADNVIFFNRYSFLDKEPSISAVRISILFLIVLISHINCIYKMIINIILLILLFFIKSKTIIIIFPISLTIGLFIILITIKKHYLKKIFILLIIILFLVIIINTNYFKYAIFYSDINNIGSGLSRFAFNLSGIELFFKNIFGYGLTYREYFQNELIKIISNIGLTNFEINEIINNFSNNFSYATPKSLIIQVMLISGLFGILYILIYYFNLIKEIIHKKDIVFINKYLYLTIIVYVFLLQSFNTLSPVLIFYSFYLIFYIRYGVLKNEENTDFISSL